MQKKFLWISSFLGMLIFAGIPAQSIQRFALQEDTLFIERDGTRVPTQVTRLTFRDKSYLALPNRRAKGWLEFNVAPDDEAGPKPVYGEAVSVILETDYGVTTCLCFKSITSGYPSTSQLTALLTLSSTENPECVILSWSDRTNSLIATSKAVTKPDHSKTEKTKPNESKKLIPQKVRN